MNKLTLLNYRIWNIYLLLLVSLLLLGCSYAGKPTFKTCQDVCDGLVGYYPFIGNANDLSVMEMMAMFQVLHLQMIGMKMLIQRICLMEKTVL